MHVVVLRFAVPAEGAGVFSDHRKAYGFTTSLEAKLFYEHFTNLLVAAGAEMRDGVDDGPYEVEMITLEMDLTSKARTMIQDYVAAAERNRQALSNRDPSLPYTAQPH